MVKIIAFCAIIIFSLFNSITNQKTCEDILKSKVKEEVMIQEIDNNMLEIKKESDKYFKLLTF